MRLENTKLSVDVLPRQGMTIVSVSAGRFGPNVLWVRSSHVPPPASRALGPSGPLSIDTLHDLLRGGWFEMSPHAGLPDLVDGHETLLHGEAVRLPWDVVAYTRDRIEASVLTVRTPLRLTRQVELHQNRIAVESRVLNLGRSAQSLVHGEHPCFSRSMFAGGELQLAARKCTVLPALDPVHAGLVSGDFEWPRATAVGGGQVDLSVIPAVADGTHDHVAIELSDPNVTLTAVGGSRVTLELIDHPYVLMWRNFGAPGCPGFGLWDVLAVEPTFAPGRSVADAVSAGSMHMLGCDEEVAFRMVMQLDAGG